MKDHIFIDGAGRIVLPKAIREKLHIVAGDLLDISVENEEVRLHPVRSGSSLRKEDGFWVFRTGRPFDATETDELLSSLREERHAKVAKGSD